MWNRSARVKKHYSTQTRFGKHGRLLEHHVQRQTNHEAFYLYQVGSKIGCDFSGVFCF
jgi:predicted  nucleic acid-binding Zn ribbon protein